MADGITLPVAVPLGGGVMMYLGTFIHTAGAAECTFIVGNARVYDVRVTTMDSDSKSSFTTSKPFSESVSGGTNTVTVYELSTIADGRIVVLAAA